MLVTIAKNLLLSTKPDCEATEALQVEGSFVLVLPGTTQIQTFARRRGASTRPEQLRRGFSGLACKVPSWILTSVGQALRSFGFRLEDGEGKDAVAGQVQSFQDVLRCS